MLQAGMAQRSGRGRCGVGTIVQGRCLSARQHSRTSCSSARARTCRGPTSTSPSSPRALRRNEGEDEDRRRYRGYAPCGEAYARGGDQKAVRTAIEGLLA